MIFNNKQSLSRKTSVVPSDEKTGQNSIVGNILSGRFEIRQNHRKSNIGSSQKLVNSDKNFWSYHGNYEDSKILHQIFCDCGTDEKIKIKNVVRCWYPFESLVPMLVDNEYTLLMFISENVCVCTVHLYNAVMKVYYLQKVIYNSLSSNDFKIFVNLEKAWKGLDRQWQ